MPNEADDDAPVLFEFKDWGLTLQLSPICEGAITITVSDIAGDPIEFSLGAKDVPALVAAIVETSAASWQTDPETLIGPHDAVAGE